MISAVALDKFRPDATRSGYFPLRVGGDADAGADLPEQDELDSSSSGSEDEEAPDHDEIECLRCYGSLGTQAGAA